MDTSSTAMWLARAGWLLWAIYWGLSARNLKSESRGESRLLTALKYTLPLLLAVLLLSMHFGGWLDMHWFPPSPAASWAGLALLLPGLLLACWARAILGTNWSGLVELKQDHELIRSGPYAYARHPIYTGLLLAMAGMALMIGQWRALLALAIVFVVLLYKIRLEERWLSELFGESYARYQRQTKALIPGLL